MVWSQPGGVETQLLPWTVSESMSTLPCALHVLFQCSAPHLGGNFCTPKMKPWLLAQQSVATKARSQITYLASRIQHCWTDAHQEQMRAPCSPLCCNPMVGQACPVGLPHTSLPVAWMEPPASQAFHQNCLARKVKMQGLFLNPNSYLWKQGVDLSFLLHSTEAIVCIVPSGCCIPQCAGAMGEGRDEVGAVTPCLPSACVWQLVIKLSV